MKQGSTLFLKAVIVFMGILVFALCLLLLPAIAIEASTVYSSLIYMPIIGAMYLSAVPFFFALYQALRLLSYIDENKAFSELSIKALKNIKFCAIAICMFQLALLPILFIIAQDDDAPGLVIFGLIIPFASFAVATFAAVLQKLLHTGLDLKSEVELTV